jgi:hypothetical protein
MILVLFLENAEERSYFSSDVETFEVTNFNVDMKDSEKVQESLKKDKEKGVPGIVKKILLHRNFVFLTFWCRCLLWDVNF